MDAVLENTILAEAQELIAKSGFQLSLRNWNVWK